MQGEPGPLPLPSVATPKPGPRASTALGGQPGRCRSARRTRGQLRTLALISGSGRLTDTPSTRTVAPAAANPASSPAQLPPEPTAITTSRRLLSRRSCPASSRRPPRSPPRPARSSRRAGIGNGPPPGPRGAPGPAARSARPPRPGRCRRSGRSVAPAAAASARLGAPAGRPRRPARRPARRPGRPARRPGTKFEPGPPPVTSTSAPSASAAPSRYSSGRALFPAVPNPVRSSRFSHSGPPPAPPPAAPPGAPASAASPTGTAWPRTHGSAHRPSMRRTQVGTSAPCTHGLRRQPRPHPHTRFARRAVRPPPLARHHAHLPPRTALSHARCVRTCRSLSGQQAHTGCSGVRSAG